MEVKTEMKCYKVERTCPQCNHDMLVFLTFSEGQFVHECLTCRHTEILAERYPLMKFEEIKQ